MGYTKHQGKYFKDKYHNNEKFRREVIRNVARYNKNHPIKTWARHSIDNHKRKNIIVLITKKELEALANNTKTCKFCGKTLEYSNGKYVNQKRTINLYSASLDQIDKTKPLTLNNVQILCWQCNSAKNTMCMDEFRIWVKNIYESMYP
jgi:5-methylcytosine-specific restriction endonuclease McrA